MAVEEGRYVLAENSVLVLDVCGSLCFDQSKHRQGRFLPCVDNTYVEPMERNEEVQWWGRKKVQQRKLQNF